MPTVRNRMAISLLKVWEHWQWHGSRSAIERASGAPEAEPAGLWRAPVWPMGCRRAHEAFVGGICRQAAIVRHRTKDRSGHGSGVITILRLVQGHRDDEARSVGREEAEHRRIVAASHVPVTVDF